MVKGKTRDKLKKQMRLNNFIGVSALCLKLWWCVTLQAFRKDRRIEERNKVEKEYSGPQARKY